MSAPVRVVLVDDQPLFRAGEIFAAAPPELTRSISLQQTLQLVRVAVDVVEENSDQLAAPGDERDLREAVLRYSREVAFSAAEVYAWVRDPAHLPLWAAGLATGIRRERGEWVADSPMGRVLVRFVPVNEYGVLDHDVVLPDGTTTTNPSW